MSFHYMEKKKKNVAFLKKKYLPILNRRYRIFFDTPSPHIDPYRQFADPSPPKPCRRLLWTAPWHNFSSRAASSIWSARSQGRISSLSWLNFGQKKPKVPATRDANIKTRTIPMVISDLSNEKRGK